MSLLRDGGSFCTTMSKKPKLKNTFNNVSMVPNCEKFFRLRWIFEQEADWHCDFIREWDTEGVDRKTIRKKFSKRPNKLNGRWHEKKKIWIADFGRLRLPGFPLSAFKLNTFLRKTCQKFFMEEIKPFVSTTDWNINT